MLTRDKARMNHSQSHQIKSSVPLLISGFIVVIILVLVFALMGLQENKKLAVLNDKMYIHPFTVSNKVLEVRIHIVSMHRYMKDVVLTTDEQEVTTAISLVNEHEKEVYRHFVLIKERFLGDMEIVNDAHSAFINWETIRNEVINLKRNNQHRKAAAITIGKGAEHVLLMTQKMDILKDFASNKAIEFNNNSQQAYKQARLYLYALLAFILIASVATALFIVTRFKRAESLLSNREQQLNLVLEGSDLGFWDWDIPSGKVHRSGIWAEMLGYTYEELESSTRQWSDFVHSDDLQDAWKSINDVLEGHSSAHELVYRMLTKSGEYKWILDRAKVVQRDTEGKAIRMAGTHSDYTERKQAEAVIARSETKFHTLFDTSADGILMLDETGFFDCNQAALTLFGLQSQEELRQYHPADLSPATQACGIDSKTLAKRYIDSAMQNGTAHFEWTHKRADSEITFVTDIVLTSLTLDGKLILQTSIRDITERKQIEQTAAEKEEQLLSFYKSDIVGLTITSPEKGWLRINNCLCEMLEYSEEELHRMTWEQLTHPNDLAADVEQFTRLLANDIDTYSLEKRFISRTGKIIPTNLVVSCVRKPDGQVHYVTAMVQDISERKLTEQQLRIAATAFESQEGIMVLDVEMTIIRVNKAFTTITGYNEEEVIGKTPKLLASGQHDALFYDAMWKEINTTGYWGGEIWNKRKDGDVYPEKLTITAVKDSVGEVANYVGTFTDITLKKQAEQEIEDLAYFDPLTHLPNRRLMIDRIKHAMAANTRSGKGGGLLFLDLDHFKDINDTLGHDMGDLLLQQVAERLTSCLREGDTVSRFGGDEFVVLLEGLSSHSIDSATQAEDIANKILSSINLPYQLISHHYTSSASIGISLFDDHKYDVDEVLKQADIAMYQAKNDGRNALRFFDPQMQANISARVEIEKDLYQAIVEQQFQLYYQIQLDDSLHPLGAEALIRWNHPDRGLVSPIDFIPVAEQNGAILAIGQWVLDTACAQLKVWQHNDATRDLTLSVNVSAKQFRQAGFTSQIIMAVQQYAINPARLKLELTESLLLDNIEETITKMNTLADIGIQFSLDDFGTGYSSLQYLKRLPLYQLKIDKSFVDDIVSGSNDQAIVRTIIAMAHSLGLNVIAEGVETKEQQHCLLTEGCTHYQGYLFSKPVPIDGFEALLEQS